MSTAPDRYLPIDEEGFFVFEHNRVTDADVGRPLLDNLTAHEDGNRFVTSLNGQLAWVESFDEPLVARHVSAGDAEHGVLDLVYGAQAKFSYASLTVDEWDRFHGRSEKGVPFVFSRQAQMEFFELYQIYTLLWVFVFYLNKYILILNLFLSFRNIQNQLFLYC